ncbi:hypothetical protein PI124_g2779 [Phytophthora idaei]|nr:hypothetical protein PI126_g1995 [Phytophthora idaei]KAG3252629.1 hypothetical protein PI124_g2779 [Phytophthora idaei]
MKRPPPVISPGCCSTLPTSGDDHCQLPQVLPPHALFPRQDITFQRICCILHKIAVVFEEGFRKFNIIVLKLVLLNK